jgi:retron-type reverse transcriptase
MMGILDWLTRLLGGGASPRTSRPAFGRAAEAAPDGLPAIKYRLSLNRRRLAYYAFHATDHYRRVEITKRSGATRVLHVPPKSLRFIQRRILTRVLNRVPLERCVKGFRRRHSIRSNARPHVGKAVVVNLDIRDFFPTITAARVCGMFKSLGLRPGEAQVLTRLTTYEDRLPQGAPTSPAISNVICRKLDRRLCGLARAINADYTRYADDMTFSGPEGIQRVLPLVRRIIAEEGFAVARQKERVSRRGRRQQVTGLVVNERISVPRRERRRLRAIVHNCVRDGVTSQSRGDPLFLQRLVGRIEFVRMIDPAKGDRLLAELARAEA